MPSNTADPELGLTQRGGGHRPAPSLPDADGGETVSQLPRVTESPRNSSTARRGTCGPSSAFSVHRVEFPSARIDASGSGSATRHLTDLRPHAPLDLTLPTGAC